MIITKDPGVWYYSIVFTFCVFSLIVSELIPLNIAYIIQSNYYMLLKKEY